MPMKPQKLPAFCELARRNASALRGAKAFLACAAGIAAGALSFASSHPEQAAAAGATRSAALQRRAAAKDQGLSAPGALLRKR